MHSADEYLDPALPLADVAAEIRDRWEVHQGVEYSLCLGLRRLFRDNLHRGVGISSFGAYADAKLGIPERLAWTFSCLGRDLERLPLVREAMARGEITYTKAREFAGKITAEEQELWVDFARTATNRQIEARAAGWESERAGISPPAAKKQVVSSLNGEQVQIVRKVRESLMMETGESVATEDVLPLLAARHLAGSAEEKKMPLPYAAIHFCPGCLSSWVPTPAKNMAVDVKEFIEAIRDGADVVNLLPDLLCDCSDTKHRRDECPDGRDPDGCAATRRYVPAEVQRRIDARDGFRCRTPGCSNPLPIENGHMPIPYRHGAPMAPEFLGHQCAACNRLLESGKLRVVGYPPYEKYYLADGTFLGFGFDPEPWNRVSHVGDGQRADRNGVPPPPGVTSS